MERAWQLRRVWPELTLSNMGPYFVSDFVRYKRRFGLARPWAADPSAWSRIDIFNDAVRQYTNGEPPDEAPVTMAHSEARGFRTRMPGGAPPKVANSSPASREQIVLTQLCLWNDLESIA
jgi:hypothetical protein